MENSLLIGLSRQIALQRELDVVANNVANLNTSGYKSDNSVFQEYLMPIAQANQFLAPDRQLSFVQDRATWHDLGQGPLQQTGNPLDVAIEGDAFLVVQTPGGERYTRNGALQINAAGELVTSDGFRLAGENGPIVLQPNDQNVTIAQDGTITVREGANATIDAVRGKLRLVSFAQPQRLQKDGTSTFLAPPGVQPAPATSSRVVQGAIEKSNVRSVAEMSRLIEITRSYTAIAAMLDRQGEMQRTAIERLADVPA
jgi:flagellar basal-body rod protein FlgF/flagellar basal-body rod protein FlgG